MKPKIMFKNQLTVLGIKGDGNQTALLWDNFEKKSNEASIEYKIDENGYEIRFYYENKCDCFVGLAVSDIGVNNAFDSICLPASEYAVFDVAVANGYDSGNKAMEDWLKTNPEKYTERKIEDKSYVVECYNEKFKNGIVEIWVPICKG